MKKNIRHKLKGVIPPLLTPLNENYDLDIKALERLIEYVIKGGVHGIFILGTTGELPRLDSNIKESIIKQTCRIVNGRLPVLVGITDTSMRESLKLEKIAKKNGADSVVASPPFYYPLNQQEILVYYEELANSISLPLYLYNMPSRTNIALAIETVKKAVLLPGIVGIKDSSGDFEYLQKLIYTLKEHPDISILAGPEEFLAQAVQSGASGGVNGGANLFPELFVQLYSASVNKDIELIKKLQTLVIQISSSLYQVGKSQANFIKILKEALHQKGICQPYLAKPYVPFSDEEKGEIANCLLKIEVPGKD